MILPVSAADARTLMTGDNAQYKSLRDAMAAAQDGDTIHLGAGEYFECASVGQRNLTIEGEGIQTILTDTVCEGKALFVVRGDNFVLRNLVLGRTRAGDLNGAGIRLEAKNLRTERVRFQELEVGILGGAAGSGNIVVLDCTFEGGGRAGDRPTAALLIGNAALLQVERSTFTDIAGKQIASIADLTILQDNRIETGVEPGAGAAVHIPSGTLIMRGNTLVVGPNAPPYEAAVAVQGSAAELRNNTLENKTGGQVRLLLDWMPVDPVVAANKIGAGDVEVSSRGLFRHRLGIVLRGFYDSAKDVARFWDRTLRRLLGF